MANIERTIKFIKGWEGGWANHPLDRGGCTNSGITIGAYRTAYGQDKTCDDLKTLTDEQWEYIFRKFYWDKIHGDEIEDENIALLFADMAWGSGAKTSIKKVQKVLGVTVDGIVGKETLGAINGSSSKMDLFSSLKHMRMEWLNAIVRCNPSQQVFIKGWVRRLMCISYECRK